MRGLLGAEGRIWGRGRVTDLSLERSLVERARIPEPPVKLPPLPSWSRHHFAMVGLGERRRHSA
jgi:hypothetical protein